MSELTKGRAELFEVDKAVLVLVYQAEDPEGEGALVGAESPGVQQGEEHTELLETELVLLQIGQAGVMMKQNWTLHCPVAAEEMLPLKNNIYIFHFKIFVLFYYEMCYLCMITRKTLYYIKVHQALNSL